MRLSIVIPAYNEERRIGKTIDKIGKFFKKRGLKFELIVVDDGSYDKTVEAAVKAGKKLENFKIISHPKNFGKGAAVKTGVLRASGDYILFTDADLSVPIKESKRLLREFKNGYDVVIGSRKDESRILRRQSFLREFLGKTFSWFAKKIILEGIYDTQCGFKLFKSKIGKRAFRKIKTNNVLFDIEFLLLAYKEGARIKEVPVIWRHDPDTRIRYNIFSSIRIFLSLLEIKRRWGLFFPVRVYQE